jgi:hypothetical protein
MARQAAHNVWLERLARFGMLGYGVTHVLVGWIALQLAFGKAAKDGDQSGAFKTLAEQPLGKFLLIAVAVGLVAMVLWQALEAAVGHTEDTGKERVFERVASAFKAVFYGYLAYKAVAVVQGSGKSSGDQQQQTTSTVLESTGGRWLVGVVGLAIAIAGAGLVWYGVTKKFEKHLKTGTMSAKVRKTMRGLGVAGYAAKGTVYGVVGILVLIAAVNFDPGKSRGLDQALRTLSAQPAGDLLLICVALGLLAYGAFCFGQAKYRKV